MGKNPRSWEGRETDYKNKVMKKAVKCGYKDVGDRLARDAQFAMRISTKPRWSPGCKWIKEVAIAVMGANFMTEADAYGEMVARPLLSATSYEAMMEVPWFLTMWSLLLAFFVAGFIFGNFQSIVWGYIWRFLKRGFGMIDEVEIDVALEVPPVIDPAEPASAPWAPRARPTTT